MEKNNYGKKKLWKNRSICPSPLILQEKNNYGNNGHLQELWKKKGSDHFRDILNPYGEKPNKRVLSSFEAILTTLDYV